MVNSKLQLVAIGQQDQHLIGNPQISYFKAVYKRHTNFTIQKKKILFNSDVVFGGLNIATLEPFGDLLYDMALVTKFNTITATTGVPSYTNAIGHSMIKEVSIKLGGYVLDTQTGEWLHIQKELTTPESQQENYNQLIGQNPLLGYGYYIGDPSGNLAVDIAGKRRKFISPNFDASTTNSGLDQIITPLRFWFCKNSYLAIPLISLSNHQLEVDVTLRPFKELFITRDLTYTSFNITESNITAGNTINEAYLLCEYIFLDEMEKRKFIQYDRDYLITQVQKTEAQISQPSATGTTSTVNLNFTNPVKELFWVVQRKDVNTYNEWFNFSNTQNLTTSYHKTSSGGVNDKAIPPIQKAKLIL